MVAVSLIAASAFTVVTALNPQPNVFFANASADTYISTLSRDQPQGGSDTLWISSVDQQESWTIISFNFGGKLRQDMMVSDARIQLTTLSMDGTFPTTIIAGRVLETWSEATATWDNAPEFGFDTRTATIVKDPRLTGEALWIDVTRILNRWHLFGGPSTFSVVLNISTDVDGASLAFASLQNQDFRGPRIQVKYLPIPVVYSVDLSLELIEKVVAPARLE
jgi:hypothetical protein